MSRVYVRFPKVGLGNMMLVWARAVVFASLNHLEYSTSSWWGLRWGALLRGEKKKRLYKNYFLETPLLKRFVLELHSRLGTITADPPVIKISESGLADPHLYVFSKVLTSNDVFGDLRNYQPLIKKELYNILSLRLKKRLEQYPSPYIGVHIRRGDFKIGNQTTELEYFVKAIVSIRKALNETKPVTVFTDAIEGELDSLLRFPNIQLAVEKPDILDILLLSQSRIIILSRSSTFGYWAAFLSDAIVIRPHNDWQSQIKTAGGQYREINWNVENVGAEEILMEKIRVNCADSH